MTAALRQCMQCMAAAAACSSRHAPPIMALPGGPQEHVLENEARMLPLLKHPNILRCYKTVRTRRHIVSEGASGGAGACH